MKTKNRTSDQLLSRLFFRMLPVQILIFAMGSINTLVDGAMAGRFIDASTVGVIGLFFSMVLILQAIGSVLLGGTSVLIGRYMGKGDLEKTDGIFSLNLTVTLIIGAVVTILCLTIPSAIADVLGASAELKDSLVTYIVGYSFGIIPMLLAQQLAAFLQLERQDKIGYFGIAAMIISNVLMDILLVGVMHLGVWGLALATSISNALYFLILVPYYFSTRSKFHYHIRQALWKDLGKLIGIGFPGALLVLCLSIRGLFINRILLTYSGNDGLSAMSAYSMINGLLLAYCLVNGAIIRTLTSVFVGEEDKHSIKALIRIAMTKGLLLSVILGAFFALISSFLTGIFFPDPASNVYHLTHQLFVIFACCVPLVFICQVATNYLQATGHFLFVNIQSVFDGFFSMVIPSALLAPILGTIGVWIANPIGIVLTILTVPIYNLIYWKRPAKNADEILFLRPDFGAAPEDTLDIPIRELSDVSNSSEKVQSFCETHGMSKKSSMYSALCLEEMAGNVVNHGFSADRKEHSLNIRAVYKSGDMLLRIKDDCMPFDPAEMADMLAEKKDDISIGIRMVQKIAEEVTYQNLLGLNVLTILIREENLVDSAATDFLLEKTLRKLDKDLLRRFNNVALVAQNVLTKYKALFPEYTDHTELHSMTVIDFCNRLIGESQISKLNADEIYILLVACYLHDVGMGINEKDFDEFSEKLHADRFFQEHPNATKADFVRTYHNEFSALYIEKYAELYDIPSPEHTFAIREVARGHRKTDLFSESEYPSAYPLPNGNTVCLPYLAALIRLADEVDVVASRNPMILYDTDSQSTTSEQQMRENKKLYAVKAMKITKEAFVLFAEEDDPAVIESLEAMAAEIQSKLDYCREVIEKRSDLTLTQKKVILNITRRQAR